MDLQRARERIAATFRWDRIALAYGDLYEGRAPAWRVASLAGPRRAVGLAATPNPDVGRHARSAAPDLDPAMGAEDHSNPA
jgi:hypothetical protein